MALEYKGVDPNVDSSNQNSLNSIFGEKYVAFKNVIFSSQFYYGIDTRKCTNTAVDGGTGTISGTWTDVDADNSILKYSTDAVFDLTGDLEVALIDSISTSETKTEPFLEGIDLPLRSNKVAIFAITTSTTLALEWIFSNYWSEEF